MKYLPTHRYIEDAQPVLLKIAQAARFLDLPTYEVRRLIKDGIIPSARFMDRRDLRVYLNRVASGTVIDPRDSDGDDDGEG